MIKFESVHECFIITVGGKNDKTQLQIFSNLTVDLKPFRLNQGLETRAHRSMPRKTTVHLCKCGYCITVKQCAPWLRRTTSKVNKRPFLCLQFGAGRTGEEPPWFAIRDVNVNVQLVVDDVSHILRLHCYLGQASQYSGRRLIDHSNLF